MSGTRGKARAAAQAAEEEQPVKVVVSNLPTETTLGDLESLVLPKCSGRIMGIGMKGEGNAFIDFALPSDADACLGDHDFLGATVRLARAVSDEDPPGGVKRPRAASADGAASASSSAAPAADPAAAATGAPPPDVDDDELEESLGAAASRSSSVAAGGGGGDGAPMVVTAAPTLLDPVPGALTIAAVVTGEPDPPAYGGPVSKRQRAETKKEKEKRLNRVGLSYRCGRCGQPKKGHVCHGGLPGEAGPVDVAAVASAAAVAAAAASKSSPSENSDVATAAAGGEGGASGRTPPGWELDSDSIFKDIKSVLQTPAGAVAPAAGGKAGSSNANGKATGGSKRKGSGAKGMPPPPVAAVVAEKAQLLEEIDIAMQRPPSVITPDDGEAASRGGMGSAGPSSLGAAPSSLVSASDMFSPGQLMTHLLGTPTPAITPGLSPGTLNELGNMLQSPGAALASAKKAAEAAEAATGALETPGP